MLLDQQAHIKGEEDDGPLRISEGDMVLLRNKRRRKGDSSKLQPPFCGPYEILKFSQTTFTRLTI